MTDRVTYLIAVAALFVAVLAWREARLNRAFSWPYPGQGESEA